MVPSSYKVKPNPPTVKRRGWILGWIWIPLIQDRELNQIVYHRYTTLSPATVYMCNTSSLTYPWNPKP